MNLSKSVLMLAGAITAVVVLASAFCARPAATPEGEAMLRAPIDVTVPRRAPDKVLPFEATPVLPDIAFPLQSSWDDSLGGFTDTLNVGFQYIWSAGFKYLVIEGAVVSAHTEAPRATPIFRMAMKVPIPGDITNDGNFNIADLTLLVNWLFQGGQP